MAHHPPFYYGAPMAQWLLRMIDLNTWHHAIHQITGGMALRFNKAAADDTAPVGQGVARQLLRDGSRG